MKQKIFAKSLDKRFRLCYTKYIENKGEMLMTYNIYQLKQYANKFLKDNYNMELAIPLQLNSRMQRTCGWFKHTRIKPTCIELNKFFVENNEPVTVLDVLRHELVHYVMFMQGKQYKDGSYDFERELKRLGIVSQSTIDKYEIESKPVNMIVYKCIMPTCGQEYKRQRKLKGDGAFHKCHCGGTLQNIGKRLVTA